MRMTQQLQHSQYLVIFTKNSVSRIVLTISKLNTELLAVKSFTEIYGL